MGGCEGEGGQVFLNDVFPSMISLFCYYDGLEAKRSSDVHPRRDYDGQSRFEIFVTSRGTGILRRSSGRSDRRSSSRAEAGRGDARGIERVCQEGRGKPSGEGQGGTSRSG